MSIIFPKKCLLCCTALPLIGTGEAMLCAECAGRVRRSYRCTEGLRVQGTDGAAAALYYTGLVAEAMKRFKFRHLQNYAAWFAAQAAVVLAEQLAAWRPDIITFVPISPLRRYQRGYNQSELLACAIAAPFALPVMPLLCKRPFVRRQSNLHGYAARENNVRKAFFPLRSAEIEGKRIVLVDDILTTGATMQAGAKVLRSMGASHVFALSATRTR